MPLQELDKRYVRDLNRIVDDIFACATDVYDYAWEELAHRSNLAISTVYNLGNRVTRLPRLHTVWKLANAVGMKVSLTNKYPKIARRAG